jgi:uncharacterized protein (TIGR03437 family)
MATAIDGLLQHYFHSLAHEALEVRRGQERALHAGAGNFQRVLAARNDVFHVENGAHLLGNTFAIGMGNGGTAIFADAIDRNAQMAMAATAAELDFHHFHAFGSGDAVGNCPDFFNDQICGHRQSFDKQTTNKKVGLRPPFCWGQAYLYPQNSAIRSIPQTRLIANSAYIMQQSEVFNTLLFRHTLLAALCCSALFAQAFRGNAGFRENVLTRNDDGSSGAVALPFPINFFGVSRSSVYVNNNGNVTLDSPQETFSPDPLPNLRQQIIAPFWADVDTRGLRSSQVTYGFSTVDGRRAFGANWQNVGYFDRVDTRLNSFQLVIIERSDTGAGNVDIEFNYERIQWETGDESGGQNGLGGRSARVGFSNGTGLPESSYELPGSGIVGNFLDNGAGALIRRAVGSELQGRLIFRIRNTEVIQTLNTNVPNLVFDANNALAIITPQQVGVFANGTPLNFSVSAQTADGGNWLIVQTITGQTRGGSFFVRTDPTVIPRPGGYLGTIIVSTPSAPTVTPLRIPVTFNFGLNVPFTTRAAAVNAGSFVAGVLPPGSLFTVFGVRLSTNVVAADVVPFPDTLDGVSVTIGGRPAPLFLVSTGQINGQVPYTLPPGPQPLVVTRNGIASAPITVDVAPSLPGIFLRPGTNDGIIQNQDGSLHGSLRPARVGETIVVYLTGIGNVDQTVTAGVPAPPVLSRAVLPSAAVIDGRDAPISYMGLTPGFVGLAQANVFIPAGVEAGPRQLLLRVGNATTSPVLCYIGR